MCGLERGCECVCQVWLVRRKKERKRKGEKAMTERLSTGGQNYFYVGHELTLFLWNRGILWKSQGMIAITYAIAFNFYYVTAAAVNRNRQKLLYYNNVEIFICTWFNRPLKAIHLTNHLVCQCNTKPLLLLFHLQINVPRHPTVPLYANRRTPNANQSPCT